MTAAKRSVPAPCASCRAAIAALIRRPSLERKVKCTALQGRRTAPIVAGFLDPFLRLTLPPRQALCRARRAPAIVGADWEHGRLARFREQAGRLRSQRPSLHAEIKR